MSTTGGNVEGYLLKVDDASGAASTRIVYCILDEGLLQLFSRKGGELLGAVALTGAKIDVFLLPPDKANASAFHFRVDAQPRPPVAPSKSAARSPKQLRPKASVTLAAATKELADQWAVSILNWNRYSWDDPMTLCSSKDEFATLREILQPSVVGGGGGRAPKPSDAFVPVGVSRAVQPL